LYTDEGAKNIQRAVRFAKQLGLTLDTTAKISEKLLDVETAIGAGLKIQAVLGQQFSLDEAVRLNFLGKVGAAQEELTKQVRDAVTAQGKTWADLLTPQRQVLMQELGLTGAELMKMVQGGVTGVAQTVTPLSVPKTVATDDNTKALVDTMNDGFDGMGKAIGELRSSNKKAIEYLGS
jgi:phosphotransferase system IIB component